MSTLTEACPPSEAPATVELTYREAINAALARRDGRATRRSSSWARTSTPTAACSRPTPGLVEKFGPERVRTTPICENGFVGVALGMSLVGLRPIVEIMFADFLPTAGDAIVNQLPKYRFMSGGQCAVPVTLRVICGGDRPVRDAALGDVRELVHAPARAAGRDARRRPASAYALLRAAIADDNPVIFFEHKALYARKGPVRARRRSPSSARPRSCARAAT